MMRKTVLLKEVSAGATHLRDVSTSYVEEGDGCPVLLLHGGCVAGSAMHTWSDTVRGLSDRYRVIALDLLWSGYTDKPAVPVTLPLQAAHVIAFAKTLGLESVKVVGQSIGAYLAACFACDYVDKTSHLVMISSNTVALSMNVPFEVETTATDSSLDESKRQRELLNKLYHRKDLITDALIDERAAIGRLPGVAQSRRSFAEYSAALLNRSPQVFTPFALVDRLPALRIPSLLLWGAEDRFAPVSIGRALAPLLPRTRYFEVQGGGHAVYRDQALIVNELLAQFLSNSLSEAGLPPAVTARVTSAF